MSRLPRSSPHVSSAVGRDSGRIILSVLSGIALFAVMTLVGYAFTAQLQPEEPEAVALAQYSGIEVLERTDEVVADIADATERESLTRALVEAGAFEDPDVAEAMSAAIGTRAGSTGSSSTGAVTESAVPDSTPDPTDDDVSEPHPVPEEVLTDDPSVTAFIDWDAITVADVPTGYRFDFCAGESPLGVPLPGCPEGTGAAIVPVSGDSIRPYRAEIYLTGTIALGCQSDNDVFRVAVLTNRPSEISLSVWNYRTGDGSFDAPPPRGASTLAFETLPEDATRWYEQLDTGTPDFLIHCLEFTDLDYGRVGVYLRGVSQFSLDAGSIAEDDRASMWRRATSERPPSSLTAIGFETLYVKAFRRSSVDEQIFVQARPLFEQGCDNQGDIARLGDSPETVQGVLDQTYEIDTLAGGWRWGLEWDRLDVQRLYLRDGERYIVCIFWVESGGPVFEPGRVTLTEAVIVLPPDVNTMTINLDTIRFADWVGDNPRIDRVTVEVDLDNCLDASVRTNTEEYDLYVLEARYLCQPGSLEGLINRGSFVTTVTANDKRGRTYVRSSLVRIDRGAITCGGPCGVRRRLVGVPLPNVPSELPGGLTGEWDVDIPFFPSLESGALPSDPAEDEVPGSTGPSAGTATLELLYTPSETTGARSWLFGEPIEIEQSASRAPLRPQIEVRVTNPGDGYYFADDERTDPIAKVQVEVLADRPVDIAATVAGSPGEACLKGVSTPPSYTNTSRAVRHVFELDNLCVGTGYNIVIAATDETGTTGELVGIGPADGTTPWRFVTEYIRVAVYAELTFADPGPVPSDSPSDAWYFSHDPHLAVLPLTSPGFRTATPRWTVATLGSVERSMTGWSSNVPYDNVLCDRSYDATLSRSLPRSIPGTGSLWPVITDERGVRVMLNATLSVGQLGDEIGGAFGFSSCTASVRDAISSYTFDEELSLTDLARGAEFVSDDGVVRLWVSSRPRG